MTPGSMPLFQPRVQRIAHPAGCDDRHGESRDDPALDGLASEIGHRHPPHEPHDVIVSLDREPCDIEARHLDVLDEGEFPLMIPRHSSILSHGT